MSDLKALALQLKSYEGKDKLLSSETAKKIEDAKPSPDKMFTSDFVALDNMVEGGICPGELVVVSGLPKEGKTTMTQSMATNFCLEGDKCLFFSFEMPTRQFLGNWKTLPKGLYVPGDYPHVKDKVDWIRQRVIEGKVKDGLDVVFIDHLHYILNDGQFDSNSIGVVVRRLKRLAMECKVAIVLICHITKVPLDRRPEINDIRDSGMIAAEADLVIMIWRRKKKNNDGEYDYTNEGRLSVVANRRTGLVGHFTIRMIDGFFKEDRAALKEYWEKS